MVGKRSQKKTELIVGYFKHNGGKSSLTWSQSADQALCFGWIDSFIKSINAESCSIRFTPRRRRSSWSEINIKKVEELMKSGLMKPAKLESFSQFHERESKTYSHKNILLT